MKNQLKKIIKEFGYEIHKVKPIVQEDPKMHPYLKNFFKTVQYIGFNPKHIVDIGANHGNWTRSALHYFPDAAYTLIEPQHWLKPFFQDLLDSHKKIKYYPLGVGKTNGNFNFTITEYDDSSNFRMTAEEAEKHNLKQEIITVERLDKIIKDNNLELPELVKIDAEGLDLDVLDGASMLFGVTEIFMVEAAVNNKIFDNTFLKVINYMDEKGYKLFDITDLNKPFPIKILWLTELTFIKKGGLIDSFEIKDYSRTGIKPN